MPRYRLLIAYEGTDFHGWQKQHQPLGAAGAPHVLGPAPTTPARGDAAEDKTLPRRALRTVQQVIEDAVFDVVRTRVNIQGASRTDSGVHARAQTAAFTTAADRLGPADDRLAMALNSRLPADILVLDCQPAPPTFDPIRDCLAKGYRYTIRTGLQRPLWDRRVVTHLRYDLDLAAMQAAAELFIGAHDFAAFASAGHGRESTIRQVLNCQVAAVDPRSITIDISGNGFLYNMVRIIVGTLVEIGRGRRTPDDIEGALASGDRRLAGPTMRPEGLCLMWSQYPEPIGRLGAG